jgi:hypothetical protein
MSNLKSTNYYEQIGDGLTGRRALAAYVHAQDDLMAPPVAWDGIASWRRLQAKIIRTRALILRTK